jgi:hypothetical protein
VNASIDKIVAIHGAPRSGTSWLGQIFNSSEHVAFRYQPLFSYAFKGRLTARSKTEEIARFFDDLLATDDEFVMQRGAASLAGYELAFRKSEITHLTFKEVRYHEIIENLLVQEPKALGIGIVRDPRSVIRSWLHAPREFRSDWDPRIEWRTGALKNAGQPENWYGYERWKELASLFERLAAHFPERFEIVRYESLCANPESTVAHLFDKCHLRLTEQVLKFVEESRSRDDGSPYGVFRNASQEQAEHVRDLDPLIKLAIEQDLCGTSLARYLDCDDSRVSPRA